MDRLSIETYNNTKSGNGNVNSGAGVNASSIKNFYPYDGRGSVSELTGMTGTVTAKYRYNDFGKLKEIQKFNTADENGKENSSVLDALGNLFGINNSKDQEQDQNQTPGYHEFFAYNAESYNPNTEMQYLRARYYKPETANFLTEDSYLGDILKPLTLNRYNYCAGNPVNYKDPSGNTLMDIELQAWEKVKSKIGEVAEKVADKVGEVAEAAIDKAIEVTRKAVAVETIAILAGPEIVKNFGNGLVDSVVEGIVSTLEAPAELWMGFGAFLGAPVFGHTELGDRINHTAEIMSDVSKAVRGLFGIDQYLEKRGENATIPDAYYAGRVTGSVAQTAAGILTTIKGAIETGAGGAATLAGLVVGGSTSPITVGVTAAGVAELAVGASLMYGGLSNARKAVDEGKRKRREREEARREAAEEQKKQAENENKLKKESDSAKTAGESDTCPNAGKTNSGNAASIKNIDDFIEGNKSFDNVLDDYAKVYADKINSNQAWSWDDSIPGGENLTKKQRGLIKQQAIDTGLIPDIKITKVKGMKYGFADFESAGIVKTTQYLPENMWKMSDAEQFKWLSKLVEL